MVMICSIIVYFTNPNVAKYVDPGMSILSAAILLFLKYPMSKWLLVKTKNNENNSHYTYLSLVSWYLKYNNRYLI